MRLTCPLCGDRDSREFSYRGSAKLLERPKDDGGAAAFHGYLNIRENPAGPNTELWQHVTGCRAWLHVERDTVTHEVGPVQVVARMRRIQT